MTLRVRAKVTRFPKTGWANDLPWLAVAYVETDPDDDTRPDLFELDWTATVTAAIQRVVIMRDALDRQLMDEVNESRASRRQAPRDIHTMEPTA